MQWLKQQDFNSAKFCDDDDDDDDDSRYNKRRFTLKYITYFLRNPLLLPGVTEASS
jgi:hypothetical protein